MLGNVLLLSILRMQRAVYKEEYRAIHCSSSYHRALHNERAIRLQKLIDEINLKIKELD